MSDLSTDETDKHKQDLKSDETLVFRSTENGTMTGCIGFMYIYMYHGHAFYPLTPQMLPATPKEHSFESSICNICN